MKSPAAPSCHDETPHCVSSNAWFWSNRSSFFHLRCPTDAQCIEPNMLRHFIRMYSMQRARTVFEHLVMCYASIAMLTMRLTAKLRIMCPMPCIKYPTAFGLCGTHQNFFALCVGRVKGRREKCSFCTLD